jgi:diguanylate cyclase (GGDEF)-like protein/PAS domain S-box-containing protein
MLSQYLSFRTLRCATIALFLAAVPEGFVSPNLGPGRRGHSQEFALKTKRIGLKLGIAFTVLIALLAGIVQFGLRRMQRIDETLSDITGKKSTDLELARRALTLSDDNSRIAMEIVLVENRRLVEPLVAARFQNSKEITKLIEESESRCESEKEKQVLTEVKKTRKLYLESCQRATHLLIDERKHDEAEAVMVNETLPALHTYHAAWERFVEFQKEELDEAVKQAQDDYAKARRLASLLIGLAVVLAIVIALFATRKTAHEMAARIEAEKEVSKLNAGLEERVTQRTSELRVANEELTSEIDKRERVQESYRQEVVAREDVEIELRRSDERMRMAVEAAGIGFWDWDIIRDEQVWSDICKELLGLRPESTANFQVLMNSVHPDDRKMMDDEINAAIREKRDYGLEFRVVWPDGSVHWQAARGRAFYDETGHTTRMAGISMDIDERKHAEERLHLQVAALEAAANAIVITDSHGTIMWVNHAFTTMTGYSKEEALGKNPRLLKSGKQPESYYTNLWSTISSGKVWRGEIVNRRKDGTSYSEEMTITPVTRDVGNPANGYFVAIKQDITQRKDAEKQIQYHAYYDALTGLPNRTLLQDRLSHALARARRQTDRVALLFLDLDRFKFVNDSLGHSVGDLFLQAVAERLKRWAREQDTVARLGGDEFIILLTHVKDIADAAVAAGRLMDAMTAEFVVQGHSLSIGCSVGISIFPEHGADSETLIRNADAAMYTAKESGRNNFRFFTSDMDAQAMERLTLENGLRLALPQKELFLVYQPQMDIVSGKISGLEALLRWQHPKLGFVPPDRFIRIAENCGLIVPIGEWVLRTACSQARKWQEEGLPAVSVAVNVSAVQFRQDDFCETIRKVLKETRLAPEYLELELTESLLLANADVMLSVVEELKAMGLTLAIDDFGTGYSSFSYLKRYRVSKLKIDRVFIRDVAMNPDDAAITTAIISMAKSLRLKVIAEGVENEEQMAFLRAHQCDVSRLRHNLTQNKSTIVP